MPDLTAEQYREAQRAEYGTYVANVAIDIDGARAFNVGDPVPVSHINNGVVDEGQVSKLTTKAGRTAAGIDETKG
jgi:hypothetical protein